MPKIIQYMIIRSGNNEDALMNSVNLALTEGWQPLGGVSVALNAIGDYHYMDFAQAMVKYETPEDEARKAYTASPHLVLDWVNKNK